VVLDTLGVPPLERAGSLRLLLAHYPLVVTGVVEGVRETIPPGPVDVPPDELPPGVVSALPQTIWSFEVADVLHGHQVKSGDTIGVRQLGGPWDGGVIVEFEGDPFLQIGATYLLFLSDLRPYLRLDVWDSPVFARFEIENGLIQPNPWPGHGIVAINGVTPQEVDQARHAANPEQALKALARATVDDVKSLIAAALAEGPLPTPDLPPPPYPDEPAATPAATPTPGANPGPAPTAQPEATPAPQPEATAAAEATAAPEEDG
jgi:hypothetical protein